MNPSDVGNLLEFLNKSSTDPKKDQILGIPSSFTGIDLCSIKKNLDKHQKVLTCKLGRNIHLATALLDLLDINPNGSTINKFCLLRKSALNNLIQTALFDNLTGLYSRNILENRLQEEFKRARRYKLPLSVLFIDLDSFKIVNDNYGHLEGNKVLSHIGNYIRAQLRDVDFPVRYGGEEILVILPHTNGKTALNLAKRIHKGIEKSQKIADLQTTVTLSIGVGTMASTISSKDQLVEAADRSLYKAKKAGKNMVWPMVNADPIRTT